jgi:hypothetical protein
MLRIDIDTLLAWNWVVCRCRVLCLALGLLFWLSSHSCCNIEPSRHSKIRRRSVSQMPMPMMADGCCCGDPNNVVLDLNNQSQTTNDNLPFIKTAQYVEYDYTSSTL